MPRSMFLGLDGSAYSDAATELGIRWSKRFACPLTGVAIVDEPTINEMGGVHRPLDMEDRLLGDAHRHAVQLLDQFAYHCEQADAPFERHEDIGAPYDQIVDDAQEHDMLLLGQRTYFRYHTVLLDDETVERVIKHAPRPVVTVPAELSRGEGVLIAYDGRVQAARAVQTFLATGLQTSPKVWLMNANRSPEEAERVIAPAARFLELHGVKVERHPLATSDHTHQAILQEAERLGVEFIVMGAYGQPPLREFFLGSTTASVLKESRLPLFLYH